MNIFKLIGALLVLLSVIGVCACKGEDVIQSSRYEPVLKLHTHTYDKEWSSDEKEHWHAATCGCNDVVSDLGEHHWDEGVAAEDKMIYTCEACGYMKEAEIPDSGENGKDPIPPVETPPSALIYEWPESSRLADFGFEALCKPEGSTVRVVKEADDGENDYLSIYLADVTEAELEVFTDAISSKDIFVLNESGIIYPAYGKDACITETEYGLIWKSYHGESIMLELRYYSTSYDAYKAGEMVIDMYIEEISDPCDLITGTYTTNLVYQKIYVDGEIVKEEEFDIGENIKTDYNITYEFYGMLNVSQAIGNAEIKVYSLVEGEELFVFSYSDASMKEILVIDILGERIAVQRTTEMGSESYHQEFILIKE